MRAIACGAVSTTADEGLLSLRLVAGVATSRHPRSSGPFVEHCHVEGLLAIDRNLLSMIFDDIAEATETDIAQLADYRRAHPLGFWRRLQVWRGEVNSEAAHLRAGGHLEATRELLEDSRAALVDALHDPSLANRDWSQVAGAALVAGLDDVVVKSACSRWEDHPHDRLTGPVGVVWLACVRNGRRSGIDAIRHLFSPLRPSGYPPAQYTNLVLPPYCRPRVIDDGSLRLGG
jgi:hypothetical protein